eukprot:CAMPEP_0176391126 /NCGR_PEP_ID=MMETSP0126-20121128/39765_1 /TAXON_ID=141414 ORGANISM="Strombidinopsis acuminatum, Strain SPMC142" /NCGR_SAMPLE_ID=MMETSP0126 /ASSEMBLY_ACC=CAM_ASM_000229 /LENGTH=70 /DNA_ID=CAMNT_0017761029 /DNA_START=28 /DNA_END=240 /DNA_ORIENTATION=+
MQEHVKAFFEYESMKMIPDQKHYFVDHEKKYGLDKNQTSIREMERKEKEKYKGHFEEAQKAEVMAREYSR